jgi:hypothetical protein
MSRRKRRWLNQTDSLSRKAHLAAGKAGELLRGLGVFLTRDRSSGVVGLRILPDITYEDAVERGRRHEAFKWVERSIWDRACRTRESASDAEVSPDAVADSITGAADAAHRRSAVSTLGRGAFGAPPAALRDPSSSNLVFGPVAYECPQGTVYNPRTGGCEPL